MLVHGADVIVQDVEEKYSAVGEERNNAVVVSILKDYNLGNY